MQETASLNSAYGPRAMSTVTHCPYCAFQCGIRLRGPREQATVTGEATFPVNKGRLCIKGWNAKSQYKFCRATNSSKFRRGETYVEFALVSLCV